jgi:hypothetical protein
MNLFKGFSFVNEKPKVDEDIMRRKYGKHKDHYKWDLAKSWLTMTNDSFYDCYGFNWVPDYSWVNEVRPYIGK